MRAHLLSLCLFFGGVSLAGAATAVADEAAQARREALAKAHAEAQAKEREAAQLAAGANKPAQALAKPAPALKVPNQEVARDICESLYNTWRLSMMRGDEHAWRRSTTSSRQAKVRNLVVSQRKSFPRDFFGEGAPEPPALENFKYAGAIAACEGRTMSLSYVGRMQLGDGKPVNAAYVLLFVLEGKNWKFDQSRMFALDKLPKVKSRLEKQDISVLKEQDGFHPYYTVPVTPAPCSAPQLIGKVFVDCPGREVEMKINGISVHEFDNERRADVISGGLRRGQNTISYTFKDVEGDPRNTLGIGLFVMPETPGNQPGVVFEHILGAQGNAQGGSFTFMITKEHIAAMNPQYKGTKPDPFRPVPLEKKEVKK